MVLRVVLFDGKVLIQGRHLHRPGNHELKTQKRHTQSFIMHKYALGFLQHLRWMAFPSARFTKALVQTCLLAAEFEGILIALQYGEYWPATSLAEAPSLPTSPLGFSICGAFEIQWKLPRAGLKSLAQKSTKKRARP